MTMAVTTGMFEQIEFLSGRASQVPCQAHALMEDAHHTDAVRVDTVDDDMRANQAGAVCGRQVLSAAAPVCGLLEMACRAASSLSR